MGMALATTARGGLLRKPLLIGDVGVRRVATGFARPLVGKAAEPLERRGVADGVGPRVGARHARHAQLAELREQARGRRVGREPRVNLGAGQPPRLREGVGVAMVYYCSRPWFSEVISSRATPIFRGHLGRVREHRAQVLARDLRARARVLLGASDGLAATQAPPASSRRRSQPSVPAARPASSSSGASWSTRG